MIPLAWFANLPALGLGQFRAGEIRLVHATVFPLAGEVITESTRKAIGKAELQVLEVLFREPYPGLTKQGVAAELGITLAAVKKRLTRLGHAIGEDLVRPQPGRPYVYSVRKPKSESKP